MLKLWPDSSHVASIDNPLVVWEDAMHRYTVLLIPVFWTNLRVNVPVEGVFLSQYVASMVRTNLLLCRIDLETDNFCRYLDNSSYLTSRFNVK
jgi:hypothetical protein